MPGTLHIFRLQAAPLTYQVNYNLSTASYVKVFDPDRLEEFLHHGAGLASGDIAALLQELRTNGHIGEVAADISEAHTGEMGFAETPSDG